MLDARWRRRCGGLAAVVALDATGRRRLGRYVEEGAGWVPGVVVLLASLFDERWSGL